MLTPFDLELFVTVADTGSLTETARVCGLTRTTVTRRLEAIEERVATSLVNRSTRELVLTEAGLVYLEGCREALTRLRHAEGAVKDLGGTPRGQLRIACPIIDLENIVGPLVTSFMRAHPAIEVHAHLTSDARNPLSDGVDVVVQIGPASNASLISQCIYRESYGLVASPEYLARRGTPETVSDLASHDCITVVRSNGAREAWTRRDGTMFVPGRARFVVNAAGLARLAALEGLGIAEAASSLVSGDVAAGRLVPLLETEVHHALPVSLVYANGSRLSAKVRCFVDHATTWLQQRRRAESSRELVA